MAQVTLQVVVKRDELNKLQADVNKLNSTPINIQTKEFAGGMREAATATKDLGDNLQKVSVETKGIGTMSREIRQYKMSASEALTVTTRFNKATKQFEESTKYTRDLAKEQREAAKAAKEHEKYIAECVAEYEKYKAELAAVKTPLQQQIEAITGVTRATTNAKENYSDFGILLKEQAQQQREAARATKEAERQQKQATKEAEEHTKAVDKQSLAYKILGRSVGEFMLRMTAYRAVYAGIRAITNGFSEALETLKAVDDELVTVRKVTGFDAAQMAEVESQAYAVASKYGASASDYVSGVAAFARAGYKELSGDLAELAQKTIIVGDTTAEVANQFLLSVDAAYKFEGSVTELSKVLDAANELDNKYATSIEKIAEGMGIVAPVAAQMHVGVYELEAAIGTITAVTQRTGTEAARALRAIMLNIVGDTKTEIEEGVTWTTGEIAGLKDVIKQYAPEAYKAAQATGSIIDPMKAIGGLAQSMKSGLLTEQKLMEMVSDIGGKLRTSQLLALIQNWDMYNSMLEDTANAAGSADKEIANAMDSWTRKTNVLKNTWTEFVKTSLNSNMFKGALDAITWIVQRLDNLGSVVMRLVTIYAGLHAKDIVGLLDKAADKVKRVFTEAKEGALSFQSAAGIIGIAIAAITAAWSAYSFAVEDAKRKQKDAAEASYENAAAAEESADNMLTLYANFNMAKEGSDSLTESAQKLAEALGTDIPEGAEKAGVALTELTREKIEAAISKLNTAKINAGKMLAGQDANGDVTDFWGSYILLGDRELHQIARDADSGQLRGSGTTRANAELLRELVLQATSGLDFDDDGFLVNTAERAAQFREAMQTISDGIDEYIRKTNDASVLDSDYYKQLQGYLLDTKDAFQTYIDATKELDAEKLKLKFFDISSAIRVDSVEAYEDLVQRIHLHLLSTEEEKEAMIALAEYYYPQYASAVNEAADAIENSKSTFEKETDALFANQKALDANATATDRAAAAKKDAEKAVAAHIDALFDETGALTEAGKAAFTASQYLADLAKAELEARNEAAKANYAALRAELAGVSAQALKAAYALLAMEAAVGNGDGIIVNEYNRIAGVNGGQAGRAAEILRQLQALESEMNSITAASQAVTPYATSTSTSSGSGRGSGGRSNSSSSSKTTEDKKLTSLKDRVSLLKSELSLMQERGDSEEDQIAKMREIMEALSAEADYLKSIKGDQVTINNLYQEWYSYHNKIEDLMNKEAEDAEKQAKALQDALDAQRALNNALNNRNVRIYNSATGQWEWTANPSDVSAAQDKLRNAIANLPADQQSQFAYYLNHTPGGGPMGSTLYDFLPGEIAAALAANTGIPGRGGVNNYGNTYNFGGMTFSQAQANSMTLAQFAQLAGGLSIYNNSP